MKKIIDDDGNYEVSSGEYVCVIGDAKPTISQTGGDVWTYGKSAPVIHMIGRGVVRTRDVSAPVIIILGAGLVRAQDLSAPIIHIISGNGEAITDDSSRPVIHISNGKVYIYGESEPVIHLSGNGEVITSNSPIKVRKELTIHPSGGKVHYAAYDNSEPNGVLCPHEREKRVRF